MPPRAGLGEFFGSLGSIQDSTLAFVQAEKQRQAMEAYQQSLMGQAAQRLALEVAKMHQPQFFGPNTWMIPPGGGPAVQVTPNAPSREQRTLDQIREEAKARAEGAAAVKPPKEGKSLQDIEAEAAARARGTASVKPEPTPKTQSIEQLTAAALRGDKEAQAILNDMEKRQSRIAAAGAESRGRSYGENRPLNFLDAANGNAPTTMTYREMREANQQTPGRFIPATPGVQSLTRTALVEEIRGASNDVKLALERLPEFSAGFAAQLAGVLRSTDPRSALSTFLTSRIAGTLTPEEYDYATAVRSLIESSYALRTVLGAGQGSDLLRSAIEVTVPGAGTPSKQAALRQLSVLNTQIDRLSRGIPLVQLRPAPPPPTPSGRTVGPGVLPKATAGEKKRYDKSGKAFVNRNGQVIEVQP